jgi:hypothetical protein
VITITESRAIANAAMPAGVRDLPITIEKRYLMGCA